MPQKTIDGMVAVARNHRLDFPLAMVEQARVISDPGQAGFSVDHHPQLVCQVQVLGRGGLEMGAQQVEAGFFHQGDLADHHFAVGMGDQIDREVWL